MTDLRNLQAFALYMQKTDIRFDLYSVTKEMEKQVHYHFFRWPFAYKYALIFISTLVEITSACCSYSPLKKTGRKAKYYDEG